MHSFRYIAVALSAIALLILGRWSVSPLEAQSNSDQTWCLTFHEVHPEITAQKALDTQVPAGYRVYPAAENAGGDKFLLREAPVMSSKDVADAGTGFDARTAQPVITFRFNTAAARKFGSFTRDNIGRPVAIMLNGRVISAPVIREPILGGTGQISGSLTTDDAQRIATKLKSGTCP